MSLALSLPRPFPRLRRPRCAPLTLEATEGAADAMSDAALRDLVARAEAYVEDSPLCRVGARALELQRATVGLSGYVGPLNPLAGTVFGGAACGSVQEPPFLSAPNPDFRKYGEEQD